MPAPATSGQLRTKLEDMQIGDYIACKYTASSGKAGSFSDLGGIVDTEIPVTSINVPNGYFYFIKVNKGLLIADRVVQHSISWNTLNAAGFIEGKLYIGYLIRSLSGGVTYIDVNGNPVTTAPNPQLGAWPENEYSKYIQNSKLGQVWNDTVSSWTKDTPHISLGAAGNRVNRQGANLSQIVSTTANTTIGFRPVLEYIDSSIPSKRRPTTLWY